jgi:hypothetical protein
MRVMIGMPTLGSVDYRMAAFLYDLIKSSKHELRIVHTPRSETCQARNRLIKVFLDSGDDYLLFLDDDNIPDDLGFLDRLIDAKKPVVSGLVPSRLADEQGRHRLCVFLETSEGGKREYVQQFSIPEGPEVMPIANCGMGCVLIARGVARVVSEAFVMPCEMGLRTYWRDDDGTFVRDDMADMTKVKDGTLNFQRFMSEDLIFFERARDLGVTIWAHKGVTCWHVGESKQITVKGNICSQ